VRVALETSPDKPVPVRVIAEAIRSWVARLGTVFIEGQVAEINQRDRTTYLVLRDTEVEMSLRVNINSSVITSASVPIEAGSRVIVEAHPEFWTKNGSLSLRASALRSVGIGELLARIEHLKSVLSAEGLFDASRKKPLPFLPTTIGLICGRNSDAMHDVIENARTRWPAVTFEIREVAVQGPSAVTQVVSALKELDAQPLVDVIVIARGGGSIEDLLPFSDEGLVRAVAACSTPVVSAIGHEKDSPVLDLVADLRASTPTDAARRIVPDVDEQMRLIRDLRLRSWRSLSTKITAELSWLASLRARPLMTSPFALVEVRQSDLDDLSVRMRRCTETSLHRATDRITHLLAQIRALSPQATLERGYAVVQHPDGTVVRSADDTVLGERLRVRVSQGSFDATRS
jgi:exodeoxyribonuclease VII large subunit